MDKEEPSVSNVTQLNPHPFLSVDDAIEYLHRNKNDYKEVLVIGFTENDKFFSIQSPMSRKDALWVLELAKSHVMDY